MEDNLRSLFEGSVTLGAIAVAVAIFLLGQTDPKPPPGVFAVVSISAELLLFTGFLAFFQAVRRQRIGAVPFTSFLISFILLMVGYTWAIFWRIW